MKVLDVSASRQLVPRIRYGFLKFRNLPILLNFFNILVQKPTVGLQIRVNLQFLLVFLLRHSQLDRSKTEGVILKILDLPPFDQ
jgi:hypothetical protein